MKCIRRWTVCLTRLSSLNQNEALDKRKPQRLKNAGVIGKSA